MIGYDIYIYISPTLYIYITSYMIWMFSRMRDTENPKLWQVQTGRWWSTIKLGAPCFQANPTEFHCGDCFWLHHQVKPMGFGDLFAKRSEFGITLPCDSIRVWLQIGFIKPGHRDTKWTEAAASSATMGENPRGHFGWSKQVFFQLQAVIISCGAPDSFEVYEVGSSGNA